MKRIDADTFIKVLAKTKGRCGYCGTGLTDKTATVDHMTPVVHGGSDDIDNLIAACRKCNGQKRHKDVEEFRTFAFEAISTAIRKAFDRIDDVERFISPQDLSEIRCKIVEIDLALMRKAKEGNAKFHLDELQSKVSVMPMASSGD